MVKGPLTVTDMICWHVGMGMGLYGVKPLRLGYQNRQRIPRFFHRDPQNVPDVMQRVHWDPEFARRAGNPTTFDYGRMRETWLIHLCTDWMGDDAWLWKLDCEFRKFNYVGDTQWLRGRVVRKYLADGDRPAVDLDLEAVNQRGEVTTPGHATILLPSREHGAVRLPDPPGGATRPATARSTRSRRSSRADDATLRGRRPVGHARRRGAARHARPAEQRNAIDDAMMRRRSSTPSRAAATDEQVRVDRARRRGRPLLRRRRHRRPQRGRTTRRGPRPGSIQRRLPTQAHRLIPLVCEVQVPVVCRGAGLGRRHRLLTSRSPPTSRSPRDDARFWEPFTRARVHPRQRRDLAAAAPGRRGARPRAAAARPRAVGRRGGGVGRDPPRGAGRPSSTRAVDELAERLASGPTVALGLTKWLLHAGRDVLARAAPAQRGVRDGAVVAHGGLPRGPGRVPREARPEVHRPSER